jgi:DNA-binding XRE family transcriptional regulator
MDKQEFTYFRKKLKKTQKEMAELLGKSIKAIHSYEQGWRVIPVDVERQIYFLTSQALRKPENQKPCWKTLKCTAQKKKNCPAWMFNAGQFCWFINGTICHGEPQKSWKEKIQLCKACEVFNSILKEIEASSAL